MGAQDKLQIVIDRLERLAGPDGPDCGETAGLLRQTAEENREHRRALEAQGRAMLDRAVDETMDWLASVRVDGAVQSLQALCREAEEDTCSLLERKLQLGEHEKRILRKFVHAGMRRLVRQPILTLKSLRGESEQEQALRALEKLYGWEGEES